MEQTEHPSTQTVEVSSFADRAASVFMSPGDLYTEIAAAPVQTTTWVIPYIIALLVGVMMTVGIFSNESLKYQALETQRDAMKQQVESGKMTQEQADRAEKMVSPSLFMIIGAVGAIGVISALTFLLPLLLFVVAKVAFKFPGGYKKMLETYGIAMLIGSLGGLVTLLMMYAMDSMIASPSAVLLVRDSFDKHSFVHSVLGSLNVFTIWEVAVVGLGISKLCGKPAGAGMAATFGLWIIWVLGAGCFTMLMK
jgi:hypothetical protein